MAMPRTGSWRLVEMLDSHPAVSARGELLNPEDTNWTLARSRRTSTRKLLERGFAEGLESKPQALALIVR
jgi:hypothetical protein